MITIMQGKTFSRKLIFTSLVPKGSIVKIGAKLNIKDDEFALLKEIEIPENTSEVIFEFTPEETNLKVSDYVFQIIVIYRGEQYSAYDGKIRVKGSIYNVL